MMTPKKLQALKVIETNDIHSEIRITKAIYEGIGGTNLTIYPYTEHLEPISSSSIRVKPNNPIDISTIKRQTIKVIGNQLMYYPHTVAMGRYDSVDYILIFYKGYIPRQYTEKELDSIISSRTKARLTKLVMPKGKDKNNFQLDCRLMQLFKDGEMTIDEVVKRSIKDCSV